VGGTTGGNLAVATFETVEAYIQSFPTEVQDQLRAVRATMREAAPGTDETISYGIPTLRLIGRHVVYFASWRRHISVYPIPALEDRLAEELRPYMSGQGTLRFPLGEPIPLELIGNVVRVLMNQRRDSSG
jgi:uncharacterized protein YdhG (YjbR/CyaY superfamily)